MARAGARRAVGSTANGAASATRSALVAGAIEALREVGFSGASAREIARRAGCNQSLVFYHFGSVVNLLLAALDEVSAARGARYQSAVEQAGDPAELVATARSIFEEDLDRGYVAVLVEMIAGAQSTPGLGAEVAARIGPWRDLAADAVRGTLAGSPFGELVPAEEVAHGIVALYLGLEMLANLQDDRAAALTLFDRAALIAALIYGPAGRSGPAAGPSREAP